MKTQKPYWSRLVEFILKRHIKKFPVPSTVELPERKPMDPAENDKLLLQAREEDPAWRVLMTYAFVHVENNLAVAFDPTQSQDAQRDFKNRAAGVAAFISDVTNTREKLREEVLRKQKAEERKKS